MMNIYIFCSEKLTEHSLDDGNDIYPQSQVDIAKMGEFKHQVVEKGVRDRDLCEISPAPSSFKNFQDMK